MKRPSYADRRAFTMPELLIAIGILAIFALAASKLFQSTIRVGHAAAEQQNAANTFEAAVSVLRSDAWGATAMTSPDSNTAKIDKVTWTISGTTLARDAGDGSAVRRWPVPKGTAFAADDVAVVLRVPASSGERGGDARLVSEVAILSRLRS